MSTAIDLFAGVGGLTEGARQAGVRVIWAANHWRAAVDAHARNHADVRHECQDLHQANWLQVPAHDLLLAAPACTGHTPARGKEKPHHDAARSTAWAVVSCLEVHRPAFAIVENVPQFLRWVLFPAWRAAVEALGYSVAPHIRDAADHGVPQNRVRLLIVLSKTRAPMHLMFRDCRHVPISTVIDFSAGEWSPVERPGRAEATIARVARARREFGSRFVMPYYGNGSGLTGRSLDRPIGTIPTRDRWGLVSGDRMRMLTVDEYRSAMGFPSSYELPRSRRLAIHMLGNAVPPPMARDVVAALVAQA